MKERLSQAKKETIVRLYGTIPTKAIAKKYNISPPYVRLLAHKAKKGATVVSHGPAPRARRKNVAPKDPVIVFLECALELLRSR